MKVDCVKNALNFTGASISINALSDTHGHLDAVDKGFQTMIKHDVFEKEGEGKANFLIIGGDWFISGNKTGFKTAINKPLMKFQSEMLNKFLRKVREYAHGTIALFIPGNHDLDGGVDLFREACEEIDADILCSNLDFDNSYKLKELIDEGKIVSSKITFVSDDKDENKQHPVLNLGVAPVNLSYYQKNLDGMNLIDDKMIPQKFIDPIDYQKTLDTVCAQIKDFKEKYPKGKVILTCHTGVNFADECAKRGGIDLIFDGHEHKKEVRVVKGTPIVALSQNFDKIINAKIKIDDNGDTENVNILGLSPLKEDVEPGEIQEFHDKLFEKDIEKIYTIKSSNPDIKELDITNVRNRNSHLANFICDCILERLQAREPSVQIFALNASAIRGGFNLEGAPNVSPIEVSRCLDGINPEQANVFINEVTGKELIGLIIDNFSFNKHDTEKNPLIHYAGIKIDKTNFMKDYENGVPVSKLCQYVHLSNGDVIDPNQKYEIANPEKYFIKGNTPEIKGMLKNARPSYLNACYLFKEFFMAHDEIEITPEERLY